jgi:hypothetical protein
MSHIAEDFSKESLANPSEQHASRLSGELVTAWPVVAIPQSDFSKTIGEAAARTIDIVETPESEQRSLSAEQLDIAQRLGVRYQEFEEKIIEIKDAIVSHRDPKDDIGHYFGYTVAGSINKADTSYNLGLKELTKEGYEDLCRKYNPAASMDGIKSGGAVDKLTSHGERTDSGKIFLPNPYRKIASQPMNDHYWDPRTAAANDRRDE